MRHLLFLAHRVPYPPDKGEKIRAYHALIHLAQRFKVHLGCFADDPDDLNHLPHLQEICETVRVVSLSRRQGLARALRGFASGSSLSEQYFRDAAMTRWASEIMRRFCPQSIYVFSSAMAPYALPYASSQRVILDMVDVDSEKWRVYSGKSSWPMSLIYARESRTLLAFERSAALAFDRCLFVSMAEAESFLRLVPEAADRVGHYDNGVDLVHFDPARSYANPFHANCEAIVFVGTMNYRPNIEAAEWFARDIFPRIRASRPAAEFWIVGADPASRVTRLSRLAGVRVTGRVEDVRPYLAHSACVVTPLQIAHGVQNKVLEAMAMSKPVVATPEAAEGISAVAGEELLIAETPSAFADAVMSVLSGGGFGLGRRARKRVESDHQWSRNLQVLDDLLGEHVSDESALSHETVANALPR